MAYAFGFVGVYCELCERVRHGFEEISYAIYDLEWYTYPSEVRRLLPIIVQHAQQPVELVAFGNIPCTRNTFKNVSRITLYLNFIQFK